MNDPETARATLLQWASEKKLADAQLSEDGQTLMLGETQLIAATPLTIDFSEKSCQYSLASIYLQIIDPNQSLLVYRKACTKYHVTDPVGAHDKPTVVGYFLPEAAAAAATTDASSTAPAEAAAAPAERPKEKRRSSSDDQRSRSSRKDKESHKRSSSKHRSSSRDDKHKKKRKEVKTVTDEQLLSNLTKVADRRQDDTKLQQEEITKALSADGFEVTPEILAKFKPKADYILANEVPVGNSASILQAMNPNKSLSRVMELFMETVHPKSKSSKHGSSATSSSSQPTKKLYLLGKKPVIVVPKGMTAPITLLNAHEFFANGNFVPRDVMIKQDLNRGNTQALFSRNVPNAGLLEYEIIDNPKKLGHDLKEWERIVAVVVLGQKWQFQDWPAPYNDPVQLFSRTFGYYIGMEGSKIPPDVMGWSATQAQLSRDKRGMDQKTHANFWNLLDEYMTVHKRELLPQHHD
ncbi:hypothetical protein MPSEU_001003400 [Mayamaea pseudoterrestris]|nr:hypothetical protein MPSEU_001003400 [Mayamaea pseudoterrestris]